MHDVSPLPVYDLLRFSCKTWCIAETVDWDWIDLSAKLTAPPSTPAQASTYFGALLGIFHFSHSEKL